MSLYEKGNSTTLVEVHTRTRKILHSVYPDLLSLHKLNMAKETSLGKTRLHKPNPSLFQDPLEKELYKILHEIKSEVKIGADIKNILAEKQQKLLALGFEKIDYLEIRDEENLQLIHNVNSTKNLRIFIAVYLQNVRLIDNMPL